ncbi:serine protease AprX [Candidatus Uabimicrobium amorphum]|uniref:Serine protease AprX n=2 Tax=Uabimicrobium amorphum TaxID=2596890 RepID=A0A5S9IN11_UABAM|nr:serine protease AprX [Candidatus Uabimicrobium amorphum]
MKKWIILLCISTSFLFADVIDRELQVALDKENQQSLPIIVVLKKSIHCSQIMGELAITNEAANFHSTVVQTMKNRALESQHWLRSLCATRQFPVKNYKSYWIANMVTMTTSVTAIREIAVQPEVERIFLDAEHQFVHYIEGSKQRPGDKWGLEKIGSKQVNQNGNSGKGVVVAVIDTGVNYLHNELKGRVINGRDFANNDDDSMDDNGHGTHCAGTVAGTTLGVAPEATILAVKVMAKNGGGTWGNIASGVQYVAEFNQNGQTVDIVSMSLGGPSPIKKILRDAFDNALAMGIRFAVAAGNSGHYKSTIDSPGDQKDVVTIGATNFRNWIAPFSSRGPVIKYGEPYIKPDVVAPGVDITSCWIGGVDATRTISGTSMATPHVAGAMALLLYFQPKTKQSALLKALELTAQDLGDKGKDNNFGSGLIHIPRALAKLPALQD